MSQSLFQVLNEKVLRVFLKE